MSKRKSTSKSRKIDTESKMKWDRAIKDAENLTREYEEQVELLKASVRSFKSLRDRGAPFPVSASETEAKAA